MEFVFHSPTKVLFGPGVLTKLPEELPQGNVLLVTDETMVRLGMAQKVLELLGDRNVTVFSAVEPNPTDFSVDEAAQAARDCGASVVIGFGGGSPMDVAKGAACMAVNPGKLADYRRGGSRSFATPGLPIICIPTTAGTGSEVTFAGVFSFVEAGFKGGIITPYFYPRTALVDPELTYSVPPRGTAATGLDALTHAMESYMGQKDTPQSDGMALVAIKKVLDNLETCVSDGGNKKAREEMCIASLVASHASSQSEIALGHAAGYPVTGLYHLEHGFACALFLPENIRLAIKHRRERMEDLARYCGCSSPEDFLQRVLDLLSAVKCPMSLRELGGTEQDIPKIVGDAMAARYITNTPGGMTHQQMEEIVRSLL